MIVAIRFVGGAEDRLITSNLDSQISYDELKKHIRYVTGIPPEFQEIKFRGVNLPVVEFSLPDVKFGEELVVKHSYIHLWEDYVKCVEEVLKDDEETPEKVELAKEAVRYHERLEESEIFTVYYQLSKFELDNHGKVACWADADCRLIRKSTKEYFLNLHKERSGGQESDFHFTFETLGGRPAKTVAFVKMYGEDSISEFNVKCHYYGPKRTRADRVPNFTEFYCYKLLASIGVGLKCHIIPPIESTETEPTVFVATLWDERFEPLEDIMNENSLSVDVVVQLVLLRVLLNISNLHEWNCGRWKGTENVAIVNFTPADNYMVYADIRHELLNTSPDYEWEYAYTAVREQHDDNSWLKIVKVYFEKWDLSNKIELARAELDPNRGILKEIDDGFEEREMWGSLIDHLNDYIEASKQNVENLQTLLDSVV